MIEALRHFNIILGVVAGFCLIRPVIRGHFKEWYPEIRLAWMALSGLVVAGVYGTIEVLYFDTEYRIPMVTAALAWAILATGRDWPHD